MRGYGFSTYNRHRDGSGIAFPPACGRADLAARLPHLQRRAGSGLRHHPADSAPHRLARRMDVAFDVITDHDLDDKGVELLRPYKVVLTGSHPEYHTEGTLDALQA